jgi:hypothetical protein
MRRSPNSIWTCRLRRDLAGFAFASVALLFGAAQARPDFPPDIARHVSATVAPACSVCHLEGKTGGITVVTPFALALRAHGFTDSSDTLLTALDEMATDGTDSDGDGFSDVEELRAGTDPNSPVPGAATADTSYGCTVASPARRTGWAVPLLLVMILVFVCRPTRRR